MNDYFANIQRRAEAMVSFKMVYTVERGKRVTQNTKAYFRKTKLKGIHVIPLSKITL